ncbi:hypothetical protein [Amycolatopsis sp.]|uniref:hypothetical protein n=1 Tax=Amycolatopsis sp. TaxID=37632 RepID=UPI0026024985|nr:hypothetical protein [Amycolatopsis sp.]
MAAVPAILLAGTGCAAADFVVRSASNLTASDILLYLNADCTGQGYALPSLHQSATTLLGYKSFSIS